MKALRWHGRKDLRYEDIPEPVPGPGQLKIKVNLAGICGTDLKEYAYGPTLIPPDRAPLVAGHEFAGIVTGLGEGVTGFKEGDRVTGVGYRVCGHCYFCIRGRYNLCLNWDFTGISVDGCMADYMVAPAFSCYMIPDGVSDEAAAVVEPLAVAIHALNRGNVRAGDRMAILGDGTIGICVLMTALAAGASEVFVVSKHKGRGEVAARLGATEVIHLQDGDPAQRIRDLTDGLGVDVAVECVGNPDTPQQTMDLTRRGGMTVVTGIFEKKGEIEFNSLTFDEKTITGCAIYVHEAITALDWLKSGKIDPAPLISSIVPLKDAAAMGFEKLLTDKEENTKILLKVA